MDSGPPPATAQGGGAPAGDDDLASLLKQANTGGTEGGNFWEEINERALDVGEKDDNAIDYEDISDLAEDEDADDSATQQLSGDILQDLPDANYEQDHDDDLDDLFGGSSPVQEQSQHENVPFASVEGPLSQSDSTQHDGPVQSGDSGHESQPAFRAVNYNDLQDEEEGGNGDEDDNPEYREQMALFEQARRGHDDRLPPPPETSKEYFDRIWPNFEPGKPPRFFSLIPRKRAFFVPRTPLKLPKPLQLNKVSLDIAADQEKSFRLSSTGDAVKAGRQSEEEQSGIIQITESIEDHDGSSDEMEMDDVVGDVNDNEKFGNVSWGDLKIACEDWDLDSGDSASDDEMLGTPLDGSMENDMMHRLFGNPTKKRKLSDRTSAMQFSVYDHSDIPSWDEPEIATAQIAKKIVLDMNDPHLLLDIQQPSGEPKKPRTTGLGLKRDNRGSLANPMFKRYNISNDEAYDALKENSQQKVRSTLGHMNVEHGLPALKLQYPFYKVQLNDRELRSFHRPVITFKPGERASISPLKSVKRKTKKNLKPSESFQVAEDLNVGDNSDLLLAEYSEEYPTTLSNFGMGNKIVNYYRRKDNEDTSRPKLELGETSVLLPQDKSPFSMFGTVEPGSIVPTLHNAMYRAPVFQHEAKSTDFLVSRSSTGVGGNKYYMRNIQNLVVVGQEFPSVEVPGTHARKVTEASKKRLKMLAFRLYRKGQQRGARQPWVSNEMIRHHLPGTEIAQNRSRMREIMKYTKETGTWEPMPGEVVPDEPTLRTWIKPEDICLIDSMHAGDKQLQDAGVKMSDIRDDEDNGDTESNELKLAPWHTTKNFLNACSGKAMLELHGEGDPTARGEGFSFIKVSMKGGFKDKEESTADRVNAKNQKDLGGHSYNVQKQQTMYENAIQRIWKKQADSLSSKLDHSEWEQDVDSTVARPNADVRGRSEHGGTPSLLLARDDETMSQFSRNSGNDTRGKKLRIKRMVKNRFDEFEEQVEVITDPEVIKLYLQRKKQERLNTMRISDIKPTGDEAFDREQMAKLKAEMARLQRNVERRQGREKARGIHNPQASFDAPVNANGSKATGVTPRKCANCGEVGHIKTNKKLCPLLNGQKKQSDTFRDASAASPAPVATHSAGTPQVAGSPV
ncbi:hypothetical protein BDV95DRAFT_588707 [Massariosphaeria phaeospora]|uniref:Transcription initiation factor TFIID subunit 1 histone acetyltransferase domain-containing protein n=1 Tax=Massariosphaeria phaeospora TaxID=100035 RepID=A0A7C8HY59_9PLEO|nr:hypothetical protein BDV95DRAFT_588707 [Massariosphaeria phaeospora]